jgi:3-methyladenine DNA glycosylase AlkD
MSEKKKARPRAGDLMKGAPGTPTILGAQLFRRAVVAAMRPLANPELAKGMRAYMRDRFVYLGIPTPLRRKTSKVLIRRFRPANAAELRRSAEMLWRLREREYQYVAVDLLLYHDTLLDIKDCPWLLRLAQDKPWWDSVDSLVKVVSRVVRKQRGKGQQAMDRALRATSFWVRRIAMLHQLGWRGQTDVTRLFAYADALASEQEFFIRKAIGWALRDYAWHDPGAVRQYLEQARPRLSTLSCREAGKHCLPNT